MIVCGTGHRPDKLGGYSQDVTDKLIKVAKEWLNAGSHITEVISGMALGWDTALAYAALECGIPLAAYIPFEGQESRWPKQSQNAFNWLRNSATREVIVCEGAYAAFKMQVRNKAMVDASHTVLALWNGSDGGTANCLKYAREQNKHIENVWDNFKL